MILSKLHCFKYLLYSFLYLIDKNVSKVVFLEKPLELFAEGLGKVSDEHGERFQQTIKTIKNRYQGRIDERLNDRFLLVTKCVKANLVDILY